MYGAPGMDEIYARVHRQARRQRALASLLSWMPVTLASVSMIGTLAFLWAHLH